MSEVGKSNALFGSKLIEWEMLLVFVWFLTLEVAVIKVPLIIGNIKILEISVMFVLFDYNEITKF